MGKRYLLAALNAKYIHSNLGIYSLKAYAGRRFPGADICLGEYTINHRPDAILGDIYRRRPDVLGFSCYIWNIDMVRRLVRDVKAVLPGTEIWLGGPEVSYDAGRVMEELGELSGIMTGEGEETFARLVEYYEGGGDGLSSIPGLVYRREDGSTADTGAAPLMDMSAMPFSYENLEGLENRIVYYESSRGCPFSCSYCLSSIDKSVRFRDLSLVYRELKFFLDRRVPQVKFVDRTFNCKKSHALAIWRFLLENDNGVTNFHFEVAADLMDEEMFALIKRMRPGLIQLEIGVQTVNPSSIREIRRQMDLVKVEAAVARVKSFQNTHQHLDLIAGLPFEDLESFRRSFDCVYAMGPDQLQLGFLKVLKGSYMEEMAASYGLLHGAEPPYEVLSTRWLSYGDILELKGVEEMTEVYYNSGQFPGALKFLEKLFSSPYALFHALAGFTDSQGFGGVSVSRLARYEILWKFGSKLLGRQAAAAGGASCGLGENAPNRRFARALTQDLYLRENAKSRPSFAGDQSLYKDAAREFFIREGRERRYLKNYEGFDSKQLAKMAHLEVFPDGEALLFDYRNRNPLTGNAAVHRIALSGAGGEDGV